jgi:hypothetical protein
MGCKDGGAGCEEGLLVEYRNKKQRKENPHLKAGVASENSQAMERLGRDAQDRERGRRVYLQTLGGRAFQDITQPRMPCIAPGSCDGSSLFYGPSSNERQT